MSETTEAAETVSRKEFASYLRNLADQFESEGDAHIRIGNESVTVAPSQTVRREIRVIERSTDPPGNGQGIDLEVTWKRGE